MVARPCNLGDPSQQFQFTYTGSMFKVMARSGWVWDINYNTKNVGEHLNTYDDNGGSGQRYSVGKTNGYYTFTVENSGLCIEINGGNTADYTPAIQNGCTGGQPQQYQAMQVANNGFNGNNSVMIKNTGVNKCLKDQGKHKQVVIITCNNNDANQKFKLNWDTRGYHITGNSGNIWDVDSQSNKNGYQIHMWENSSNDNQRFGFIHEGNNWKIYAHHDAKCVDNSSGKSNDGNGIQQWDCAAGSGNQSYTVTDV